MTLRQGLPSAQPHPTSLAYVVPFVKRKIRREQKVRSGRSLGMRRSASGGRPAKGRGPPEFNSVRYTPLGWMITLATPIRSTSSSQSQNWARFSRAALAMS
jgi:hypothetical protein